MDCSDNNGCNCGGCVGGGRTSEAVEVVDCWG